MHLFGSVCYANIPEKKKLDPRCEKGLFIGYDKYSPSYLIYFPQSNAVKKNVNVKFTDKYETFPEKENNSAVQFNHANPFDDTPFNNVLQAYGDQPINPDDNPDADYDIPFLGPDVDDHEPAENLAPAANIPEPEDDRRYPERVRSKPKHLNDYHCKSAIEGKHETFDHYCKVSCSPVPSTFKQATSSDENSEWQTAMESEMSSLGENKVFTAEPLPHGKKVVGSRWVFARKSGPDQNIIHKARFVAKGFAQIEGTDYTDTFAPTAKMATIRMLVQFAAQHEMLVHQMDVKTAYLNAPIDCEVFLKPPEGFVEKDSEGRPLVWRLHKSLYGLKQSGRNWNFILSDFLKSIGFKQSEVDACLFTKFHKSAIAYIVVWVDDIVLATNSEHLLNTTKNLLKQRFKMTDLGQLSWFLGIEFNVTSGGISMCQSRYIDGILKRFGMSNCNPRSTPCELKLEKFDSSVNNTAEEVRTYRQIVGSLIYAMTCTRPDLAFVVTRLSQSLEKPSEADWITVKHVMKYLKGSINQKLMYNKADGIEISGFSDSDWASSHDRRSTTGYCFIMNSQSAVVSWKSKKQQTVALSSCEAEYMAITAATQESMFLSMLAKEFGHSTTKPINIRGDNEGSLSLVRNPVINQRSKHIDIKFHFIREKYTSGFISIAHVPSGENVADIMTKPSTRPKLNDFKVYLFGEQ